MENYYLLFIFYQFCFIFCINSPNNENNHIPFAKKNDEKAGFLEINLPPLPPKEQPFFPPGGDTDNIFMKIKQLLIRENDLNNLYHSEQEKCINYENQLKGQKIYLFFLISMTSVLFLILLNYSIRHYMKCKRKAKKKLLVKKNELMESELISSFSTFDSYKQNSSSFEQISNELSNSSNFNILIQSKKRENKEINKQNIDNKDGDEAPIRYIVKNKENKFDSDMKTLTNDENIFIESKTDKLLYKPYSEDEINK